MKLQYLLYTVTCCYGFFTSCVYAQSTHQLEITVTTLYGHIYTMEEVTCARNSTTLTVFKAPDDTKQIIAHIDYNPKEYPTTLALNTLAHIHIPYPYAVWYCNRKSGLRKRDKYLLIEVTTQAKPHTKTSYLVTHKTRLHGLRKRSDASHHSSIGLRALKKIDFHANAHMTELNL